MRTTLFLRYARCFFVLALFLGGCSLFGDGDDAPPSNDDVCEGHANEFVTQHDNGLGVTSEDCAASERGEWIDGRCYCHGE